MGSNFRDVWLSVKESPSVQQMLRTAVLAAESKGATTPVALEVSEHFALADVFLIVSGSVERNVQAISDEVEDALNTSGARTIRREGRGGGRWVLLDFGDLIVHVFHQEDREFYQLERLWKDCPVIDLEGFIAETADLHSDQADSVK